MDKQLLGRISCEINKRKVDTDLGENMETFIPYLDENIRQMIEVSKNFPLHLEPATLFATELKANE